MVITTHTGQQVNPISPDPHSIRLADIAHALSLICRWGGHCKEFYSVAQHSVIVSYICPPSIAKWGLLHDAAEAYIGDMTRPLKLQMPAFRDAETTVMRAVATAFSLPWPEPEGLKEWDNILQVLEARWLMHDNRALIHEDGRPLGELAAKVIPQQHLDLLRFSWTPRQAERKFLERFGDL